MVVELHGMRESVYVRIARMALSEKGVDYRLVEVDPFSKDMPVDYLTLHPFRRVPTLVHDGFALYETGVITRYIDEAFKGPRLQPKDPQRVARMGQIMAVVDNYGYWPMVRQVFTHSVFRPELSMPTDQAEIKAGIAGSERALQALEKLIAPHGFVAGEELTLADIHLAPMMAYFTTAQEGQTLLSRHARLSAWWEFVCTRQSVVETDPARPLP